MEVGGEGDYNLSLHRHHQNDSCIKMGSDESHFNVSVGSDGQSHKKVSTNHNLFEEKGEPKRYRTEGLPLTSLRPYRQAKPAHTVGTHHGNPLNHLTVTISRVAYFIPRAHTGIINTVKNQGEVLEKKKKIKVIVRKRQKLRRRKAWQWVKHAWLYSELLQALKGEHLSAVASQQRGPQFLRRSKNQNPPPSPLHPQNTM